ncbi:hypothetical protein MSC49_35360 [Methylosinus sp. C49]|uniref:Hint domain-containing protein n=1 Tax=Methylosinus sp. C49 TaxID=2699395 RepID=UPI00136789B7|nr:Hint domain-containing protein [Methylosinus sp. C49]BBU63601.1 hypothetical protein MSC49_35360 [Methylosinus sp. C49]
MNYVFYTSSNPVTYGSYTTLISGSNTLLGDLGSTTKNFYYQLRSASGNPAVGESIELWRYSSDSSSATLVASGVYLGKYTGGYPVISISGVYEIIGSAPLGPVSFSATAFCFLAGVKIATAAGEIPVEELKRGDLVITRFGGLRPVVWVARQRFRGEFLGEKDAPIRIVAGALGPNQPARDLVVSPRHSIFIDDLLVLAELLVNEVTIVRAPMVGEVAYYHVDLGEHDVLLADGAWAESYYELDNRQDAHNYAEYLELRPDHRPTRCKSRLPIVDSRNDERLGALRRKILDRIPADALTDDADVHLDVDGVRIEPSFHAQGVWRFEVPAGARRLRLKSRTGRPSALGAREFDERRLGIAVARMTIETRDADITLRLDGPGMGEGFWQPERQGDVVLRRWTCGDALIPADRIAGEKEPVTLIVEGSVLRVYFASGLEAPDVRSEAGARDARAAQVPVPLSARRATMA